MPIYAYRCEACGFAKDVLQKLSDPQLTDCPSCSKSVFKKQVTAAGFQLKGTGWYATDFKGGAKPPAPVTESDPPVVGAPPNDKPDSGATPATTVPATPSKVDAAASTPSSDAGTTKSTGTSGS